MATEYKIKLTNSYDTKKELRKAVANIPDQCHYIIVENKGKFSPIFFGHSSIEHGVYFLFNVIG
jgi:hypothetical protein